ncbi:hypothetical protein K438DRAFT_1964696 [Mycena galopus ATCC 62051]|nr:hypothetical protein K438DRAFT_1964696 [Mycena galopus ATCC 62051]
MSNNSETGVYVARKKQVSGDGLVLATALAPANPEVDVPEGPQDGAKIGAVFSPTINTLGMDYALILGLIRFYNEDLGIVAGDTLPMRSQKVVWWLTEPLF